MRNRFADYKLTGDVKALIEVTPEDIERYVAEHGSDIKPEDVKFTNHKIMQLNRNTIAENIKTILNEKGLSQAEVAEAIGVSPQCFNTWTQGKAIPRMGKLQALADYLHVNKSDLIEPPSEKSRMKRIMAYAERLSEMSLKVAEAYEKADERTKIAVEVALGIGGEDAV